jgi:alkylation response protein AidB-like acyl-CoA dehydrogenase
MDFLLSDEQRMLSETLNRFLHDSYPLEKRHEITRSGQGYSREIWRQFAELGAIGAMFGEEHGGYGGTGGDLAVLFEALGRALVVEPFLPVLLAGRLIAERGNGGQRALLEEAISGGRLLALAHGEAESRYSLDAVTASAKRHGGAYTITGRKSVVLGGSFADTLIISARIAPGEIALFLVNPSQAGIRISGYKTVDGYAAAEIRLENAAADPLGEESDASAAIEKAFAFAAVACCAECLGAVQKAKDLTVEYMHTRKQFNVPIGSFQALQHRMVDLLIEIEQLHSAVISAAGSLDAERTLRERRVSAAKHLAGRVGRQVAEEAIQIHGGMGMTWEYPVGHFAKRIVMIDHLFGDTDHHLARYIEMSR